MATNDARQPMYDWLAVVPAADLAAELMGSFASAPKKWKYARTLMCELFAAPWVSGPTEPRSRRLLAGRGRHATLGACRIGLQDGQ